MPVNKPKPVPEGKLFFIDLRAINEWAVIPHPVVPDPLTIITLIPADAKYLSIVDLCAAFFNIPMHENSQYIFAFTWEGQKITWTRLPQG